MFMSTKFVLAALGSAAALFGSAAAAPTIAPLDVYDPPVLVPNFATVWHPGEKTNVTWCVFFLLLSDLGDRVLRII